jgi:hypothetical protein
MVGESRIARSQGACVFLISQVSAESEAWAMGTEPASRRSTHALDQFSRRDPGKLVFIYFLCTAIA